MADDFEISSLSRRQTPLLRNRAVLEMEHFSNPSILNLFGSRLDDLHHLSNVVDDDISVPSDDLDPWTLWFRDQRLEMRFRDEYFTASLPRLQMASILGTIACGFYIFFEYDGVDIVLIMRIICTSILGGLALLLTFGYVKSANNILYLTTAQIIAGIISTFLGRLLEKVDSPSDFGILVIGLIFGCIRLDFLHSFTCATLSWMVFTAIIFSYADPKNAALSSCNLLIALIYLSGMGYFIMVYIKNYFLRRTWLGFERESIEKEQSKITKLAGCIVPKSIIPDLKEALNKHYETQSEGVVLARNIPNCSFLFASINSAAISSKDNEAVDLVQAINTFVSLIDDLCSEYGVERIKSIGNYVLVASGVPNMTPDHAHRLLGFAKKLLISVDMLRSKHVLLSDAYIKIGVNSGNCIAGVIGVTRFAYDVWGDSVNVASRMESHGEKNCIHTSETVHNLCKQTFRFIPRGPIPIKGKGIMNTYFVDSTAFEHEAQPDYFQKNGLTYSPTTNDHKDGKRVPEDELMPILSSFLNPFSLVFRDFEKEALFINRFYASKRDYRWSIIIYSTSLLVLIANDLVKGEESQKYIFVATRLGIDFALSVILILLSFLRIFRGRLARFLTVLVFTLQGASIIFRIYMWADENTFISQGSFYWTNTNIIHFFAFIHFFPKIPYLDSMGLSLATIGSLSYVYYKESSELLNEYIAIFVVFFGISTFSAYNIESYLRCCFQAALTIQDQSRLMIMEQTNTQRLLLSVLPKPIYEQLKEHDSIIAEQMDGISVLFADIVGFTVMSGEMDITSLLTLLNSLFFACDTLCLKYGVQKVKTLGDCVVIAAGLEFERSKKDIRNDKIDQLRALLRMSLELHDTARDISLKIGRKVEFRAGIASGHVVAGVIGKTKFAYDIWGDAVKEANGMESSGIPGRTQVTRGICKRMRADFDFEQNPKVDLHQGFLICGPRSTTQS